jgi:ATP/maltotriose-dependent transcriptional regulator MalT
MIGAGFKYHDLFARVLVYANWLRQRRSIMQVSLRAAKLCKQARFEEAVNLHLAVQAWDEAAGILETKGASFPIPSRALTLNYWLTQMPEPEITRALDYFCCEVNIE